MQYEKYLLRIRYLRELVIKERTGPPKELARKLGISRRMVFEYLNELKVSGKRVNYCRKRRCYFYDSGSDK